MRALVAAVACLALGCGNKKDKPPAGNPAGSAAPSGSASEPSTKPASAADAADAAVADAGCDDADIKKHVDMGLAASLAYQSVLERRTARWKKDCDAAKQDLLALEPEAARIGEAMAAFKTWGDTLTPACRTRVEELAAESPVTASLEKRTAFIETRVTPMLERCKDAPGFQDAAARGLRVLRTKPAAQ